MNTHTNDPPLVLRPPLARPRPGFWEAVLWCGVFVTGQLVGAVAGVGIAFTAYTLAAPQPAQFALDQLEGFVKAAEAKGEGPRPEMPLEIGQALAWGMLAAQFVSLGMIAVVLPRRIGRDWKRQLGVRWPAVRHVLLILLILPGFMIAADAVQSLFLWATGLKPPPLSKALNGVFGRFPWPLTALAVALGPGVVEEFWCRGFLGRGLCARYGVVAGVLLTATLFALMHVEPSQLLVIALMGLYLHFVYLAARSIWVPILLHAANNGLAILLHLTLKPTEPGGEDAAVPLVVHLAAFSLLVFGSVALWTGRAGSGESRALAAGIPRRVRSAGRERADALRRNQPGSGDVHAAVVRRVPLSGLSLPDLKNSRSHW